jgi:hypothetical protein
MTYYLLNVRFAIVYIGLYSCRHGIKRSLWACAAGIQDATTWHMSPGSLRGHLNLLEFKPTFSPLFWLLKYFLTWLSEFMTMPRVFTDGTVSNGHVTLTESRASNSTCSLCQWGIHLSVNEFYSPYFLYDALLFLFNCKFYLTNEFCT